MLGRDVQHRRAGATPLGVGLFRHPQRIDVLSVDRLTDSDQLGQVVVLLSNELHLVPQTTGFTPGTPHLEAVLRFLEGGLGGGLALFVAFQRDVEAVRLAGLGRLARRHDDFHRHGLALGGRGHDVVAGCSQRSLDVGGRFDLVQVETALSPEVAL